MKYCSKCGAQCPDGSSFCFNCGASLSPKSKLSSKGWFGRLIVVVLIFFVLGVFLDKDDTPSSSDTTQSPSVQTTSSSVSTTESTTELDVSGLSLEQAAEKIASVYSNCVYEVSEGVVTFTMPQPDSLVKSWDMMIMEQRVYYIFSQLDKIPEVTVAFVFFDVSLIGGGTRHNMYATMEDDTFHSLDFSTFTASHISELCDTWYVHPDLQ